MNGLDRLTERHEALTQTVEILARTTPEPAQPITGIPEAGSRLLPIAQIHEPRLTRLGRWRTSEMGGGYAVVSQ
jgi:hypothetical protein